MELRVELMWIFEAEDKEVAALWEGMLKESSAVADLWAQIMKKSKEDYILINLIW